MDKKYELCEYGIQKDKQKKKMCILKSECHSFECSILILLKNRKIGLLITS